MSYTCEAPVNNQCSFPVISAKAPALAHPGSDPWLQVGVLPTLGLGEGPAPLRTHQQGKGAVPCWRIQSGLDGAARSWGAGTGQQRVWCPLQRDRRPRTHLDPWPWSSRPAKYQESSALRRHRSCLVNLRAGRSAPQMHPSFPLLWRPQPFP